MNTRKLINQTECAISLKSNTGIKGSNVLNRCEFSYLLQKLKRLSSTSNINNTSTTLYKTP